MADQSVNEFFLTSSPSAATEAREALGPALAGESAALLEPATRLLSELLTTEDGRSVGGDERLSVTVLSAARSVRIEIRDGGTGVVLGGLRGLRGPRSRGWSPHLLSRIADRWGLVSGADGAWVWFELDLPR
jgi:hypothetical protein